MYTVPYAWQSLIADESHYFESKVSISGVDYGQDVIFDLSVDMQMFGAEQPTVGGCTSSELTVRLLAPSASIPRMAQVRPYIRVTNGAETSDWIPQGVFFIDTREVTANNDGLDILTLHCYDAMLKTEADYPATTHNWPMTDINVVTEIATTIGVPVDHRTNRLMSAAYQIGLPAGMSMREVLSRIAAMYCGNFLMTYDGELRLATLMELPEETNYLIDNAYNPITFGGDRILV